MVLISFYFCVCHLWSRYFVSLCVSHDLCLEMCFIPHQDQLSADMYSFVAKEIDYASYYQTVSAFRASD